MALIFLRSGRGSNPGPMRLVAEMQCCYPGFLHHRCERVGVKAEKHHSLNMQGKGEDEQVMEDGGRRVVVGKKQEFDCKGNGDDSVEEAES